MDVNNYPFLEYVAKKNKPIVISTGLSELYEIDKAIRTIENTGNDQIVILHCVSIYPPKDEEVNLNNITTLQNIYDYPIGYSDHTLGATIALASVVKGACIIEKHFTLDKNMFGWDHKVSADSEDLKTICAESKRIYKAMGNKRIYREENDERVVEFRRSIVLTRDMKKGEIITEKDIDFKRPGRGIEPGYANIIIGRKLNKDLKYDDIITFEDFE